MAITGRAQKSRWWVLIYPVLGVVLASLAYQFVVLWRQAHIIAHAAPWFLVLAVINQLAVYVVLVPAMQGFYSAAGIQLTGTRTFSLLATGMALARVVPAGEYLVWRASLHKEKGNAGATTQWLIMYLTWMLCGLVVLFEISEILTLSWFPHAHADTLAGNLRFLPIFLSLALLIAVLLVRLPWVRKTITQLAYDKFGSQAMTPIGVIRDRKLDWYVLGALTFASLATWLIEGFTLYLCLRSIGVYVPLVIAIFGFTFARLFSILPITPGSIGEIEAGTALFFAAYKYPLGPIFTATVIYRLITYWVPLLAGGVFYLLSEKDNYGPEEIARHARALKT